METIQLAARRLYAIPDAAAVRIRCTAGSLWITLDNDPRDIVLAAGESFCAPEGKRALLYALEPTAFALSAPAPECAPVRAYAIAA